jgi:hypothetical protein
MGHLRGARYAFAGAQTTRREEVAEWQLVADLFAASGEPRWS